MKNTNLKLISKILNSILSLILLLVAIFLILMIYALLTAKSGYILIIPIVFIFPLWLILTVINIISWNKFKKEKYQFGLYSSLIILLLLIIFTIWKIYSGKESEKKSNLYEKEMEQAMLEKCGDKTLVCPEVRADLKNLDIKYGIVAPY